MPACWRLEMRYWKWTVRRWHVSVWTRWPTFWARILLLQFGCSDTGGSLHVDQKSSWVASWAWTETCNKAKKKLVLWDDHNITETTTCEKLVQPGLAGRQVLNWEVGPNKSFKPWLNYPLTVILSAAVYLYLISMKTGNLILPLVLSHM